LLIKSSSGIWYKLINEGIAIATGAMFGANDKFEHYCRITFALPQNTGLAIALRKLLGAVDLSGSFLQHFDWLLYQAEAV
jgi:DNA-binding transcriptional MocR family regulator